MIKYVLILVLLCSNLLGLNLEDSGTLHMNGAKGNSHFEGQNSSLNYELKHLAIIGNWHRVNYADKKDFLYFKLEEVPNDLQINLELKRNSGVQHFPISSKSQVSLSIGIYLAV